MTIPLRVVMTIMTFFLLLLLVHITLFYDTILWISAPAYVDEHAKQNRRATALHSFGI
jgi:hypothetical protein